MMNVEDITQFEDHIDYWYKVQKMVGQTKLNM